MALESAPFGVSATGQGTVNAKKGTVSRTRGTVLCVRRRVLNQGTQSSCLPQPYSHDKSMVSPEEHREPSPVLCPLCFLNRISDKATTAFFNYVDVNYAGRVVFLLGFCSLEKNEEE